MNGENPAVIIIGGGIAGLTAAHTLAQQGIPFLLLEASARQGGVIRSELQDGFLMEAGPDTLLAQKREGLGLCRELGLGERLVPTNLKERTVYVVWRGALVPLPDGMALGIPTRLWPVFTSPLFSFLDVARMGLDLVLPARRDASDESIAAFMSRRLGRKIVAVVGEPLLAGIHSGDPARLSMQANFPRFVEYERRYGSLIRGFLAVRA
ncbi:MAG: protoporphyrinogen oxidase, partial [Vicinamibacteria bacterium]|nr:protoporphyrinogen oxidase [Vicinamibacteria bacterium]